MPELQSIIARFRPKIPTCRDFTKSVQHAEWQNIIAGFQLSLEWQTEVSIPTSRDFTKNVQHAGMTGVLAFIASVVPKSGDSTRH